MLKLKLNVEELAVESFETADGTAGRGTVRGQAITPSACPTDAYDCDPNTQGGSCIMKCTSCRWAAVDEQAPVAGIGGTDNSYVQTCMINTCQGCSDDPMYPCGTMIG